jgi:hypothetical protein
VLYFCFLANRLQLERLAERVEQLNAKLHIRKLLSMTKETEAAPHPSLEKPQSWTGIWLAAVTRPSVVTYERLIRQPSAAPKHAAVWILVSGLISGGLGSLVPLFSQLAHREPVDTGLLLAIPAIPVVAVLYWLIFVGCTQWVAHLLKGTGTYQTLAYAFATFSAPLTIAASLLALMPGNGIPLFGLYLYWLALYALAAQAVNQFSRAKAIGSILISLILLGSAFSGMAFLLLEALLRRP